MVNDNIPIAISGVGYEKRLCEFKFGIGQNQSGRSER